MGAPEPQLSVVLDEVLTGAEGLVGELFGSWG